MKIRLSVCSPAVFAFGLLFMDPAGAAVQNITARSSSNGPVQGNAITTSSAVVTCTEASGGSAGTTTYCYIQSPGWNGLVPKGQSIGTSGGGVISLNCNGQYSANGGRLECAARIDDVICSPEQSISASARGGGSTAGYAPIKGAALVQCMQATGASAANGGARCGIRAPGFTGDLTVGQTIAASGAGTVRLTCAGMYSANGGGLDCTAQVSQVCP